MAANRNPWEWVATLIWTGAGWALAGAALLAVSTTLHPDTAKDGDQRQPPGDLTPGWRPGHGWWIVLIGAAWVSGGLALAGRHRDFPVALLLPAVLGMAIFAIARPQRPEGTPPESRRRIAEAGLLLLLLIAAPVILWQEGLANTHAVAWASATVMLVVAAWGRR